MMGDAASCASLAFRPPVAVRFATDGNGDFDHGGGGRVFPIPQSCLAVRLGNQHVIPGRA
jgi:hypothetical protein